MTDLSAYSDDELAQIAGAPVSTAILNQESGNKANAPTSVDNAVGRAQIIPETFARYAKPGEKIDNDADNLAVHQRIVADLSKKANGDPARIAVGYFSGDGNIAPPESPTPWIKDHEDGNGKKVSEYVSDVLRRMGNAAVPSANAQDNKIDLSAYSDEDLAKLAGDTNEKSAEKPVASAQGPDIGPSSVKQFIDNTLEAAKSAATSTGEAVSEPYNEKNVPAFMIPADIAMKTLGKAGNAIGGTFGFLTSPITGAFATGVENSGIIPATAKGIKENLVPTDPRFSANIPADKQHEIAMEAGGNLTNALLMGLGGKKGEPEVSGISNSGSGGPPPPPPPSVNSNPLSFLKDNSSGGAGPPGGPGGFPLPKLVVDNTSGGKGIPDTVPISSSLPPFLRPKEPLPASLMKMDDTPNAQPLLVAKETYPKAQGIIAKALDAEPNINANIIADRLEAAQKSGQPITALDAATQEIGDGRQLKGLADYVANAPGKGSIMASRFATRSAQAGQRIGDMFDRAISNVPFYKVKNDAIQQMEGTGDLYKQAFAANKNMNTPKINQLLARPAGQEALKRAAYTMQNDGSLVGVSDPDLVEQAALTGQPPTGAGIASGLKMKTLHYVKKALHDMADAPSSYNQFGKRNSDGAAYMSMYHDLLKEMNENDVTRQPNKPNSGLYAQANQTYATPARVRTALEAGRNFNKMDPEEITEYLNDKNRSAPEKAAFADGARRYLQDSIDRGVRSGNTNPINMVWGTPIQKRVKALIPDEKAYNEIANFMKSEINMNSNDRILGGSPTAPRQQYGKEVKEGATKMGDIARMTDPSNAAGYVLDKIFAKHAENMTQDTAAVAMRYLTTKDPEVWRDLARRTGQTAQKKTAKP